MRRQVRNENHTALEFESRWQFFIFSIRAPRNNTARIRIKSTFQQIQRNWILEYRIAIVENDNTVLVFEQNTIQTFWRRITLDYAERFAAVDTGTSIECIDGGDILEAVTGQGSGYIVRFTKPARTSYHDGGLVTASQHGNHIGDKTEPFVDREFGLLGTSRRSADGFRGLADNIFQVFTLGTLDSLTVDNRGELGTDHENLRHINLSFVC